MARLPELLSRLGPGARIEADGSVLEALQWDRGPLDAAVISRDGLGTDLLPTRMSAWTMHLPVGGHLVLLGFDPSEYPEVIPRQGAWKSTDTRLWIPVIYEPGFQAWQCAGFIGDGA